MRILHEMRLRRRTTRAVKEKSAATSMRKKPGVSSILLMKLLRMLSMEQIQRTSSHLLRSRRTTRSRNMLIYVPQLRTTLMRRCRSSRSYGNIPAC
ncbi:hypothetical protein IG631_13320 [Alternaria alternata]|nr:hypothetical protein IG631_13320 [Alternaria alternata]